MHIVKFPWLVHRDGNHSFEAYCLCVSPDGQRLASGGLDGKIRIWAIDTLRKYQTDPKQAIDPQECRELCSMSRHTGAVTCLEFSPNGRFLASGSDDRILLIWEKDEERSRQLALRRSAGLGGILSNIENAELEHWTVRKRLVAHDNDIQDMAWAPDSSILVTVGLDRSIIVWSGTTFEKIKRFDIHQSHVKGVVFDPANKYFATCSDDRTLRIFRYRRSSATEMSFSVESVVTEPFRNTPLTTYYRRCSWSPDGQYIAAPNAINGGLCSVAIVKRGSWDSEISLLGHEMACEVCSFSPRLYRIKGKSSEELTTVLVTSGKDRALALWDTASAIPLVVARDFSAKTITDIAWDPSGQIVFLSSLDGTISCVFFDSGELGEPIPLEQNSAQLHRYGADRESMYYPESVEQLRLEDEASKVVKTTATNRMEKLMGGEQGFLKGFAEPTNAAPVINTLVPRSKKHPNRKLPVRALQPPINLLTPRSQKVTIGKDGKKHIVPTLITPMVSKPTATKKVAPRKKSRALKFISRPSYRLPRLGLQTLVTGVRDNLVYEKPAELGGTADSDIDHIAGAAGSAGSNKKHAVSKSQYSRRKRTTEYPSYMAGSITTAFTVFTDMKNQPSVIMAEKPGKDGTCFDSVLEIRNDDDPTDENDPFSEFDSIAKLFVADGGEENVFEFFKNDKVTNVTESKFTRTNRSTVDYWAVSTEKGSVFILSETGRQIIPSLELGASLTHLLSQGKYLLAVTSTGLVYSWDIDKCHKVLECVSLAPIVNQFAGVERHRHKLANSVQISELHLMDGGIPLLVLSNNNVYSYDTDLYEWVNVLDPWYFEQLSYTDLESICKFSNRLLRIVSQRAVRRQKFNNAHKETQEQKHIKSTFESIQECLVKAIDT